MNGSWNWPEGISAQPSPTLPIYLDYNIRAVIIIVAAESGPSVLIGPARNGERRVCPHWINSTYNLAVGRKRASQRLQIDVRRCLDSTRDRRVLHRRCIIEH